LVAFVEDLEGLAFGSGDAEANEVAECELETVGAVLLVGLGKALSDVNANAVVALVELEN
jgi:hypothetical protein